MNEVEMKDLMIYVERIVRPVRATERRKVMRMRRELVGHLEAALREERERGADDAGAWEGAKRRLGALGEIDAGAAAVGAWRRSGCGGRMGRGRGGCIGGRSRWAGRWEWSGCRWHSRRCSRWVRLY